ncbi:hypothetical protein GGI04_003517 [Coemansia thaxteri]|uniref:Uncharacterized protein n=1 Tax=Coemansia thaxteri TaxID=2663907 RepID=A0A9W8BHL1_9FUNG|nr:hypothetical protein H4R26_004198 [Coemansia thaxteri]KAJ2002009.1 hypothetical protein GGI04_003517 [Coemansia thaxteri]KAJ2470877.1 hypothetical protein GGI02_002639 [Coemansia sp. RSA 2322]
MDSRDWRLRWPQAALSHGTNNVVLPPSSPHVLPDSPMDAGSGNPGLGTELVPPQQTRPWWQRLLIDAMLVPFTQSFMLSIAVNWVRYWRQTGGLLGLFRSRRSPSSSE